MLFYSSKYIASCNFWCNFFVQLFCATFSCNFFMQLFHATFSCNFYMQLLHATFTCNFFFQLFLSTFHATFHNLISFKCFGTFFSATAQWCMGIGNALKKSQTKKENFIILSIILHHISILQKLIQDQGHPYYNLNTLKAHSRLRASKLWYPYF